MTTTDGGAHAAGDRLRAIFEVTEDVWRLNVSEDPDKFVSAIVDIRELACAAVRELVPVPPQPVEEFGCENDLPWELCRTCKAKQQAANRAKDGDK